MKPLDIRDISIIDAFPVYDHEKTVLNIGCGEGRIDSHLASMGYRVYATDVARESTWKDSDRLTFHESNIFDLSSFPVRNASIVICSQVLEHIKGYKVALANLLTLTEIRLIITIPYRRSFYDPGHINFWDDRDCNVAPGSSPSYHGYEDIHEFIDLCKPYMVAISKIRTKAEDVKMHQYGYLIVVDKRQDLNLFGVDGGV